MSNFKAASVLALIPLTFILVGCSSGAQQDPRTRPQLVRLVTVSDAEAGAQEFTGIVTARVQSDLGFRVAGKITKRYVDVGEVVRAGQPLMRMDLTDFTHAITTVTQNVASAKAKARQTAADEARYRGLVSTGAVSASAYDQVKADAESAQAQLAAVEAQAQVVRDQGDYSLLVADTDGTVVETLSEPGQVVSAGQTVIKLAHAGPREAEVNLPETIRPTIGSAARATIYGKHDGAEAHLRQLSDAADPTTRTYEARYVLGGADAKAPLGATVTIRFATPAESGTKRLPLAAIVDRGKGAGVWVVNAKTSTVSLRPIKVLNLGDEEATVAGDLRPGERVVALGAHLLNEGQSVRVSEPEVALR